ncbi:hypothetical protein QJQ45_003078 [Haematococcus lacustris]|nr:hypothetical protein QJQ45_003078 [Haematococcus lacustris]
MAWPLFSMSPSAPMWAAVVPAANAVRLAAVGSGVWEDPGLVASVSREGGRRELLKAGHTQDKADVPLLPVPLALLLLLLLPLLLLSLLLLLLLLPPWPHLLSGLVAVSMMCGGDGLADIVGRRYGATNKLAWNPAKSAAGSLAMLLGGTTMALGLLTLFWSLGYLTWSQARGPLDLLPQVLVCSAVATLVESLPINHVNALRLALAQPPPLHRLIVVLYRHPSSGARRGAVARCGCSAELRQLEQGSPASPAWRALALGRQRVALQGGGQLANGVAYWQEAEGLPVEQQLPSIPPLGSYRLTPAHTCLYQRVTPPHHSRTSKEHLQRAPQAPVLEASGFKPPIADDLMATTAWLQHLSPQQQGYSGHHDCDDTRHDLRGLSHSRLVPGQRLTSGGSGTGVCLYSKAQGSTLITPHDLLLLRAEGGGPGLPRRQGYAAIAPQVAAQWDLDLLAARARSLCRVVLPGASGFLGPPHLLAYWLAANLPLEGTVRDSGTGSGIGKSRREQQVQPQEGRALGSGPLVSLLLNTLLLNTLLLLLLVNTLMVNTLLLLLLLLLLPLPLTHLRQQLLEARDVGDRLRQLIQLMQGLGQLACASCGAEVAHASNSLAMTQEGVAAAFVNAHGYVHDMVTLSSLAHEDAVAHLGAPTAEHCWFPGYAWWVGDLGPQAEAAYTSVLLCHITLAPPKGTSKGHL